MTPTPVAAAGATQASASTGQPVSSPRPAPAATSAPRPAPTATPTPTTTPAPSATLPPARVIPASDVTPRRVLAIGAGWNSCAIRLDHTLVCWGFGEGTPPAGRFKSLSMGDGGNCAIRTDGRLACWGMNGSLVPKGRFTAVSADQNRACAIRVNGHIVCWHVRGHGVREQLRIDEGPPAARYTQVALNESNSCALRSDGAHVCWGEDTQALPGVFTAISMGCGVRADGEVDCLWNDRPIPAGPFTALSVGDLGRACGIRPDGTLTCWDEYEYDDGGNAVPASAAPPGTFTAVSAGSGHTCALRTDGYAVCWGQSGGYSETPAPTATMEVDVPWVASTSIPVSWSATRLFAPIKSYTVRFTSISWAGRGGRTTWTWLKDTTATGDTFRGRPGMTYCFEVRARDHAGIRSTPHRPSCTSTPLDERSMVRKGSWSELGGSQYYKGTALRTTEFFASLRMYHVNAPNVGLLATTCPTCGSVRVYHNGNLLKTISLRSPTTVHRQRFSTWFDDCQSPAACRGTVVVKVVSDGKPVIIDGLLVNGQDFG